jgi:hypothetical protein
MCRFDQPVGAAASSSANPPSANPPAPATPNPPPPPGPNPPAPPERLVQLEQQLEEAYRRLEDGASKIERATERKT